MANAQFLSLGPFFESGVLQGSAKLYHYAAGGTTLKNIWSDRAESTTLAQPFVADADGQFAFFADGLYKFVVKDTNDVTLYTWDNFLVQDFTTPTFLEGTPVTSASTIAVGPEVWTHITGSVTIATITGTIPFVWLVFDGALTLTYSANLLTPAAIDLTVQAGDVLFLVNEGSGAWRVAGQLQNDGLLIATQDARTATVDVALTVRSTTSGTPANGIGTGILLQAESADEAPSNFGQLECAASDKSAGSEDTYFQVLLRVAGAALTACYRFAATGAFNAIVTHANSADRTYTLQNASYTVIGKDTTDILTNKTFDAQGTGNSLTNVSTSALKTSTGSASGNATASVTMNDYAFSPNIQQTSGTSGSISVGPIISADSATTVGKFELTDKTAANDSFVVRWRYITASDDPTIWIAYDPLTGAIVGAWASDDPTPDGSPGITTPGMTSLLLKAGELEGLVAPGEVSAGQDWIAARKMKQVHANYRALQLKTNDAAPSTWIFTQCRLHLPNKKLVVK